MTMGMVTMATRVIKPENPRFTFSEQFTRTNFTFGDDTEGPRSTYRYDYTVGAAAGEDGPHHNTRRSILPHIGEVSCGSTLVTVPVGQTKESPQPQSLTPILKLEKKKMKPQTSVTFGNDELQRSTAYQEFTAGGMNGVRRSPCAPPRLAEVTREFIFF